MVISDGKLFMIMQSNFFLLFKLRENFRKEKCISFNWSTLSISKIDFSKRIIVIDIEVHFGI